MEDSICNFCGSDISNQTTIFEKVKNTNNNLVECNICKLRFYNPRTAFADYLKCGFGTNEAAKEEANRIFKNASFTPNNDNDGQWKHLENYYERGFIQLLMKTCPSISKCYEIGGSVGFFSHFLKNKHPHILMDGCELNKYSVQKANEEFGLNHTHGIFADVAVQYNTYDAIIALDFIEHTFTPYDDLKKMYRMMNTGGVIILKTFLEELDVDRTMEEPIGHTHHFFGHVLKSMIEKCGFTITQWRVCGIQVIIFAVKK